MDLRRLRLGILFYFSAQWMGGIIYIINIIKTLDFLDDQEKPEILLFYKSELKKFVGEINYPYLTAIEWNFPSIAYGNIVSLFKRKNIFIDKILTNYDLDAIYPLHDFPVRTRTKVKLIGWCADLQHKHYPEFFSKSQILSRNIRIKLGLRNNNYMVLSSQDVLDDFKQFFQPGDNVKMHIFHFVSVIENLDNLDIGQLMEKYNLPDNYFLVSNQFHKHKNHKVLLLALVKLKDRGIKKHMAITGKFPSASDSPYLAELHRIIEENKLHNQISLLGVIPRGEQLLIMRHSQAVLQPSLFEGWSTVIEDAKSLQVPVVASNLEVNVEQLGNAGVYFDPHNPDELTSILENYPGRNLSDLFYENYAMRIKSAAKELIEIFK